MAMVIYVFSFNSKMIITKLEGADVKILHFIFKIVTLPLFSVLICRITQLTLIIDLLSWRNYKQKQIHCFHSSDVYSRCWTVHHRQVVMHIVCQIWKYLDCFQWINYSLDTNKMPAAPLASQWLWYKNHTLWAMALRETHVKWYFDEAGSVSKIMCRVCGAQAFLIVFFGPRSTQSLKQAVFYYLNENIVQHDVLVLLPVIKAG